MFTVVALVRHLTERLAKTIQQETAMDIPNESCQLANASQGLAERRIEDTGSPMWYEVDQASEWRAMLLLFSSQLRHLVLQSPSAFLQKIREHWIVVSVEECREQVTNVVGLIAKDVYSDCVRHG